MAKFLWFVVNVEEGTVQGTNDTDEIDKIVEDDRFICIHNEGYYFCGDRLEAEVEELESPDSPEEVEED